MGMNDKCEAIAWLANIKEKYIHGGDEEFDEWRRESIDMAIKALRQPQIVRCKDCKYYITDVPARCDREQWTTGGDWFCADGECKEDDDLSEEQV